MPRALPSRKQRRVALLIESSRAYSRQLIAGIARFNHEHRRWRIEFTPRDLGDPPPGWFRQWQGDGILARVDNARMADAVLAKGVPCIDLRRAAHDPPMFSMGPDDAAVAALVFGHFRDHGFQHYGYVGIPAGILPAFDERAEHFQRLVLEAGFEFTEFRVPEAKKGDLWDRQCRSILNWLQSLPPPTAVMACNDDLGMRVLDACRCGAIPVPDAVAVAGVGNDECLCELAMPSLTSVDLDAQRIGYEAAACLERMMKGKAAPAAEIRIAPRCVVARMSTEVMATRDKAVAMAIGLIRERACEGLHVAEVLRHTCLSRSALEPRFRQVLGRTVHQEIQRVRLERARQLLTSTDMPIKELAMVAGFHQPEYMIRVFHRHTGQTPASFRKNAST